jgi:hypothetical protein
LDCFFVSQSWSLEFLASMVKTLSRDNSDHVPFAITIKTEASKSQVFGFENFWLEHDQFNIVFQQEWNIPSNITNPTP